MVTKEILQEKIEYLLSSIKLQDTITEFTKKGTKEKIEEEYKQLKRSMGEKGIPISVEEYYGLIKFRVILLPIYVYHIMNNAFVSYKADSSILTASFEGAAKNYLQNKKEYNDEDRELILKNYSLIIELIRDKDTEHLLRILSSSHIKESVPRLNKKIESDMDLKAVLFFMSAFEVDLKVARLQNVNAIMSDIKNKDTKLN